MPSAPVLAHLTEELAGADPWRLDGNAYERDRHRAMLGLLGDDTFANGLEVGCAAGAFSEPLAARCRRLLVLDVMPQAIERTRARLAGRGHVDYRVGDVLRCTGLAAAAFDLIVVSEVLYYLEHRRLVSRAVANLVERLRPGGTVLFGSAPDAVTRRWGLPCGAETAMAEWSRRLYEAGRVGCAGPGRDERSLIVRYEHVG